MCEIQHKKSAHKIVERCKFSGYLRRKFHNFLIRVIESIFWCNIKPYEILKENGTLVNCVHYVTVYTTDDLYQFLSLSVKINDINIIIEKKFNGGRQQQLYWNVVYEIRIAIKRVEKWVIL